MSNMLGNPGVLSILRRLSQEQYQEFVPKLLATGIEGSDVWDVYQRVGQNLDEFMVKVLDSTFLESIRPKIEVKTSRFEIEYRDAKATTNTTDRAATLQLGRKLATWASDAYTRKQLFSGFGAEGRRIVDASQPEFDRVAGELTWYFDEVCPPLGITRDEIYKLMG